MLKELFATYVISTVFTFTLAFPDSSVGKESAQNARDMGSIPGLNLGLPHCRQTLYHLRLIVNKGVTRYKSFYGVVQDLSLVQNCWVIQYVYFSVD